MANSTSMDDLYIVDDEYTSTAPLVLEKLTRIQEIWDEYITVSEQITNSQGGISGTRAKVYAEFIQTAKQGLNKKILEIAAKSEQDMKTYISMIDEADSVLY